MNFYQDVRLSVAQYLYMFITFIISKVKNNFGMQQTNVMYKKPEFSKENTQRYDSNLIRKIIMYISRNENEKGLSAS